MGWERLANFIMQHRFLLDAGERFYNSRRKLATAGVSLLVVMLAYHVVFGANGMLAYKQKRAERQKFQQEVLRLQQDNESIAQRIRELKSDPKAIEREAREQLKYTRPGEMVYVTPDPPPSTSASAAQKH